MKKISNTIYGLLCMGLLFSACTSQPEKMGEFNLLPLPQEFSIEGASSLAPEDLKMYYTSQGDAWPVVGDYLQSLGEGAASSAQIIYQINDALDVKAEGYLLNIGESEVTVEAKDEAGLFYAMITLNQLMEDAVEQQVNLPKCQIKDFPSVANRFMHVDIKHHREKEEYMYAMLDQFAENKINQVIIEFEDKLAYETRPVVGANDAFSIDWWIKWSEYAKARHIEVSPLVQGLGHVNFILKHEEFKHLRDDPESDWAFNPLMDETYEVQFDLYKDAIKATPFGKYVIVGGDEVETTGGALGSGQSPLELQLIWLGKVCENVVAQGRIPMVWDDQFFKLTGVHESMFDESLSPAEVDSIWDANADKLDKFIDMFPKSCVYLRWHYDNPATYGNQKSLEWFKEKGLTGVATTATTVRWVLMPQDMGKLRQIRALGEVVENKGMDDIFLSTWDDESPHFETYWRAINIYSEYAWTGMKRDLSEMKAAFRHRMFSSELADSKYAFIDDLDAPVYDWSNAFIDYIRPDRKWGMRSHLNYQGKPAKEAVINVPSAENPGAWSERYAKRLERADTLLDLALDIQARIKASQEKAVRNEYTLEVYNQINQLTIFNFQVLQTMSAYDLAKTDEDKAKFKAELKAYPAQFEKLRAGFEAVYSETRILNKPEDFIFDQNHHRHLADTEITFDWQFRPEIYMMEKIEEMK